MKIILLLFALLGASLAQNQCLEVSCIPDGDVCGNITIANFTSGPIFTCGINSFCLIETTDFGICVPRSPIGQFCPTGILNSCEQLPFQTVICTNGENLGISLREPTCMIGEGQARVNDGCISDIQCSTSGLVNCVDGICVGVHMGEICNTTTDCEIGSFCAFNSTCMPQLGEGEMCMNMGLTQMLDREACQLGFTCGSTGTCVRMFSAMEGDSCISNDECDIGLFCKIVEFSTINQEIANVRGTCTPIPESPIFCNATEDCSSLGVPPFVSCDCSGFTSDRICHISSPSSFHLFYAPFSSQLFEEIITCYKANNCSMFSFAPDSCARTKCPRESSCLLAAIEVFGPENERIFSSQCAVMPNFTCEGLISSTGEQTTGMMTTGGAVETTGEVVGPPCLDNRCCRVLSNPNPQTGEGYLEFDSSCLFGGINCLGSSGCRFCFNPQSSGNNINNLPLCTDINL